MFLNMFYGGRLKSMPPKLINDTGEHIVIRPLAYCRETDIQAYSEHMKFPIIPCNLCGSQENLQRKNIKAMLNDWHKRFPGRIESMFSAMQNVVPSHMLDKNLYDFTDLKSNATENVEGDIGFDSPEIPKSFTEQFDDADNESVSIIELK
jgi:tRNA 2-thiocytidine biosynthesis protein TtcA